MPVSAGAVLVKQPGKPFVPAAQTGSLAHAVNPVLDDFTGTSLNSYWVQSVDDSSGGAALPAISGGSLGGGITGSTSIVWNRERFGADQAVAFTVNTKPVADSTNIHVGVRIANATSASSLTGYQAYCRHFTASDTFEIGRRDAGVFTSLTTQLPLTWAVGDVFELRAIGSTISFWQQSGGTGAFTQLASVTDSTYSAAGRINLGGVGTQWRIWVLRAGSLPYVPLINLQGKTLLGTVHASSQGGNPLMTLNGQVIVLPTLVKQVFITKTVVNPPAAQLFKQTATTRTAAATSVGTVSTTHSQAVKVLTAAASASASIVRAKLLSLTAGFNTFIPPGFLNVTPVASISKTFVQGKVLTGTVVTAASKTFQLSFSKSATFATAASLTSLKAQHLQSVAASAVSTALTLVRQVGLRIRGTVLVDPSVISSRPYALLATVSETAFISSTVTAGIATITLVPATSGTLTLVEADSGTFHLYPIV